MRFLLQAVLFSALALSWGCKTTTTTTTVEPPLKPLVVPKSKSAKIIEYNGLYYQEGTTIPFSGQQVSYWPNGRMMQEVSFRNGKKHGKERRWFYNGKAYYEKNYLRGKLHGVNKEWGMQGDLKVSEIWESGTILK